VPADVLTYDEQLAVGTEQTGGVQAAGAVEEPLSPA